MDNKLNEILNRQIAEAQEADKKFAESITIDGIGEGLRQSVSIIIFIIMLVAIYCTTFLPLRIMTDLKDWALAARHTVRIPAELASEVDPDEARLLATLHFELKKLDLLFTSQGEAELFAKLKAAEDNYKGEEK